MGPNTWDLLIEEQEQYLAQFSNNKTFLQNLAFSMSETSLHYYFQKVGLSFLIFLYTFCVGNGSGSSSLTLQIRME